MRAASSRCLLAVAVVLAAVEQSTAQKPPTPYNVLFIAVDDLAPRLGCYGDAVARTPNIDRLARQGLLFERAYCQQALCNPSRTSLLTGRRPETTKVYDLTTHFRRTIPDAVPLPQQFKKHGYHTQALGKIYHAVFLTRKGEGGPGNDDPPSWSAPWWAPQPHYYHSPHGVEIARQWFARTYHKTGDEIAQWKDEIIRGLPWEAPDVPDSEVLDGRIADRTIEVLGLLKERRKPFFLAVGFCKPHLPFVAPKKYFDLYPPEKVLLPDNRRHPNGSPSFASSQSGELKVYHGMDKKLSEKEARELTRAYYACISYVDAQVGRLLQELQRLHLRDKTVVLLWGDHGFHLGENGLWCKKTNYETSLRVPLLIAVPGQKNTGAKTTALVEFVDVYPTLADVCGVPLPEGLEGVSFRPLLEDPRRPWKKAAFSCCPRGKLMAVSMRTDRYRCTEWAEKDKAPEAIELYDLRDDPGGNTNIAGAPENKELLAQLRRQLHAGWSAARPPRSN